MTENSLKRNISLDARNAKHTVLNHPEIKQWFIDGGYSKSTNTGKSYENIMAKVSDYEINFQNGKDIYEFNPDEIIEMLKVFISNSPTSLSVYVSIIRKYISFCIQQGYIETNFDFTKDITYEKLSKMINKNKTYQKYITRSELYELIEETYNENGKLVSGLINAQDQAIIMLDFEGIKGKENEDLINLKWKNINFEKSTIMINDKEILINRRTMKILEKCQNQDVYHIKNGEYTSTKRTDGDREILRHWECEYFIRSIKEKDNSLGKLTNQTVQRRILSSFKEILDMPLITANSLYTSGLIERAIKYSDTVLHDKMRNTDFQSWIKDNDEHVNLQNTYAIYEQIYCEQKGIDLEQG